MDSNHYVVCVGCFTYNHENYICDAMNGFVIQQTTFPVVYCIIDDASTDNNASVIETYVSQNFTLDVPQAYEKDEEYGHEIFVRHKTNENCWFVVILLNENHYIKKKSKIPYITPWRSNAKYYAICEGDDYWTDPNKLQKQVEVLESHPDCTMVCNRTKLFSVRQNKFIGEQYCLHNEGWLNPVDVINRTGLYISTCSIIHRSWIRSENYPEYCSKCSIGDLPLQIYCAMKGKAYYIDEIMSVYRTENKESYSGKNNPHKISVNQRINYVRPIVEMFKGFSKDYPKYSKCLKDKIAHQINGWAPDNSSQEDRRAYKSAFKEEINKYSLFWKVDLYLRHSNLFRIKKLFDKFFFKKYKNTKIIY